MYTFYVIKWGRVDEVKVGNRDPEAFDPEEKQHVTMAVMERALKEFRNPSNLYIDKFYLVSETQRFAHCSLITVAVLVVVTIIVILTVYSPMRMKLKNHFIGSNRLPHDGRPSGSKAADDDYFNRRYFDLKNYSISHGDSDLISQNQITVKTYTTEDVVKCFDLLSTSPTGGNHRPMQFAFVGDSTIRQHFVSFLRWIPDYDRITKTSNSSWFTDDYFHEDRNVTSVLLNHLRVSYYWRFLIEQDVFTDFKPWASASNHDNATSPDFILLGITAHHVDINNVTDSLETFVHLLEHKLVPLIKKSMTANPRQKIVWLLQSRTILQMTPKVYRIHPDDIFKYNKEIRRLFEGTGVVIWDSINPIVEEDTRACTLNEFERNDRRGYTRCYDFIHPGLGTVTLGTHLIFNYLCGSTDIF